MLGNIFIIAIAAGLLYFIFKIFRSELKLKPLYHVTALFSALALIFMIIIPNIDFIRSPIIPSIHGKMLDVETKHPIDNVNILVTTYYEQSIFMSLMTTVTSQYIIASDKNGEFSIGMRLKYLSFHFPCSYVPLITRQIGGRYLTSWKNGYKPIYDKNANIYYMKKIHSKKDKLLEIRRINDILKSSSNIYQEDSVDALKTYLDELIRETPVNLNTMFWIEEK